MACEVDPNPIRSPAWASTDWLRSAKPRMTRRSVSTTINICCHASHCNPGVFVTWQKHTNTHGNGTDGHQWVAKQVGKNESLAHRQRRCDDKRQSYFVQSVQPLGPYLTLATTLQGRLWASFTDKKNQVSEICYNVSKTVCGRTGTPTRVGWSRNSKPGFPSIKGSCACSETAVVWVPGPPTHLHPCSTSFPGASAEASGMEGKGHWA